MPWLVGGTLLIANMKYYVAIIAVVGLVLHAELIAQISLPLTVAAGRIDFEVEIEHVIEQSEHLNILRQLMSPEEFQKVDLAELESSNIVTYFLSIDDRAFLLSPFDLKTLSSEKKYGVNDWVLYRGASNCYEIIFKDRQININHDWHRAFSDRVYSLDRKKLDDGKLQTRLYPVVLAYNFGFRDDPRGFQWLNGTISGETEEYFYQGHYKLNGEQLSQLSYRRYYKIDDRLVTEVDLEYTYMGDSPIHLSEIHYRSVSNSESDLSAQAKDHYRIRFMNSSYSRTNIPSDLEDPSYFVRDLDLRFGYFSVVGNVRSRLRTESMQQQQQEKSKMGVVTLAILGLISISIFHLYSKRSKHLAN